MASECKEQVAEIDALTSDIEVLENDNLVFVAQLEKKLRQTEEKNTHASSTEIQIQQRQAQIKETGTKIDNLGREADLLDHEYRELQNHKDAF